MTDNVQAAFDRAVEEGAAAVSPPQTKPWGQDVAYVRDPDGNLVELRLAGLAADAGVHLVEERVRVLELEVLGEVARGLVAGRAAQRHV